MELNNEKIRFQNHDHDQLLKAHAHMWNHAFNFIKSMSLKCAVELCIPDIIHRHGGPMTLSELLAALPSVSQSKSQHIHRLMRVLVQSGFFSIHKVGENHSENGYQLTPESLLLLKDHPLNGRPYILLVLDPILAEPWQCLSSWYQSDDPGSTPFSMANGKLFWDLAGHENQFNRLFNEAMASDSWLIAEVVMGKWKEMFDGLNSMVDVGGGTGTMAKAIADAFPSLQCTVLDLPHVVAGLKDCNNLKFVAGNMFDYIPPANAIFFKMIFHLLSDEESLKLLKKCKEALIKKKEENGSSNGKLMIIEIVMENENRVHHRAAETTELYDLEMMVLVSGKERTEKEWAKLFIDAGFTAYKINHILGLRALIEVFP